MARAVLNCRTRDGIHLQALRRQSESPRDSGIAKKSRMGGGSARAPVDDHSTPDGAQPPCGRRLMSLQRVHAVGSFTHRKIPRRYGEPPARGRKCSFSAPSWMSFLAATSRSIEKKMLPEVAAVFDSPHCSRAPSRSRVVERERARHHASRRCSRRADAGADRFRKRASRSRGRRPSGRRWKAPLAADQINRIASSSKIGRRARAKAAAKLVAALERA